MSKEAAAEAAKIGKMAGQLAVSMGAETVIVMIGMPDGEHSAFYAAFHGPCLPARGLLEIGAESIRKQITFPDQVTEA